MSTLATKQPKKNCVRIVFPSGNYELNGPILVYTDRPCFVEGVTSATAEDHVVNVALRKSPHKRGAALTTAKIRN